uniref:Uncharacterized protein n=1 Tax=Odontella aurita TaxID=265563 RepID=A0A7S4K556_9STRA|mmetsp:Transcript_61198/g.181003  ORF Transcript_61198/g.181003 Transcript_61198/m.181003 type:complete len:378 (+) Transcript_61198:208-1341(+)|eukprot:CAMPEP_0113548904 /NCGR_PEP_ID=MMETSP0015_2-20120614/13143_1 /TAXON_ID=2838 /ORGANISM="Odontella" /LENGTH=377 /DNA_ID=CAMNT_0000449567 /DNA_START=183 /DNA_END=1316 /DNA_ORIENTATION=- /assembly_acc=CAM_ASM_000160
MMVILATIVLPSVLLAPDLVIGWSGWPPSGCRTRERNAAFVRTCTLAGSTSREMCGARSRAVFQAKSGAKSSSDDDHDGKEDDDGSEAEIPEIGTTLGSSASRTIIEGIEDAVRAAGLGDENYKFGDLSRRTLSDFTKVTEGAIRGATGNETYEFGDYTKRAVSDIKKTAEDAAKVVTKNEEFELGLYARVLLRGRERVTKKQDKFVSELISDLLGDYNIPFFENLTSEQKRGLVRALIQLAALACLSLNFVMNIFSGIAVVSAWAATASKTGSSPLSSAASWGAFLSSHSTLRIFTGPATMPVQCVAALFLAPRYKRWLLWLQTSLSDKFGRGTVKLSHRIGAIGAAWLCINCIGIAGVTLVGVWIAGAMLGIPLR